MALFTFVLLCRCLRHALSCNCQVRWRFRLQQRVWLNFTNQRRPYQEQPLTVWQAHRPLSSGFELSLPVPSNSSACAGFGAPSFGYVLCLCAVRGAGRGLAGGPGRAASIAAQLMHSKDSNPATATLQQIYTTSKKVCWTLQAWMLLQRGTC
jgi:hypothetical protein